MKTTTAIDIFSTFQSVDDPRMERTKLHCLYEMIVIAVCAAICGAEGWVDVERFGRSKLDWFRKFLPLENGIPSHDTFGRVFARLDTEQFYTCLTGWLEVFGQSMQGQAVAIDGKTLRRSFDKATGRKAVHVVSAWASGLKICLGQVAVDEKSNEIPAVPRLLEFLELSGAVVTLDAMHCQQETASAIRNKGADYILPVKGNQPKLMSLIGEIFEKHGEDNYKSREVRTHRTQETNRQRDEIRICTVAPAPASLKKGGQWAGIKTIGMMYRFRDVQKDQPEEAITYFISSLPPRVKRISSHLRDHWGIENSLHWILDVTFAEDASRIRKGTAPEISSIFRRMALSILQQDTSLKSSIRGKRLQAGWNTKLLEQILTAFNPL